MKDVRRKRGHSRWLHFHKALKEEGLIYAAKIQDNVYLWGVERRQEAGVWESCKLWFPDLGAGYIAVSRFLKIHQPELMIYEYI